jgi:hypothetical protein
MCLEHEYSAAQGCRSLVNLIREHSPALFIVDGSTLVKPKNAKVTKVSQASKLFI